MDADDFQDLYKLLRGSRSAIAVLDARALYLENRMVASLEKLVYARESFVETRSRLINQDVKQQVDSKAKDADLQIKKLKRKQDKVLDTVKGFDELLPALEKLAEREKARKAKEAADHSAAVDLPEHAESEVQQEPLGGGQPAADSAVARSADVSQAFIESFQGVEGDELLDVISDQFGFREVQSEQDILGDALYYIQTSKGNFLVVTPATEEMTDSITLTSAIDGKPIKPFSRKAFLQLGRRRRMVLLTKREERSDANSRD